MYQVTIIQTSDSWWLRVGSDTQVLLLEQHLKLIDALDMASSLSLHVENVSELPLNQYKYAA